MFVTITRINQEGHEKEIVVDTEEIVFVTETEDHVCYDKPTKFEKVIDEETGEETNEPVEWETEKRYLIAFKNGKHPQFLDKKNYDVIKQILTNK